MALLAIAVCAVARADEAPTAVPVDGRPFAAELSGADAAWQLSFRTAEGPRNISAAELVRWGQCSARGRAGRLRLRNGSLLEADATAADRDRVSARSRLLGSLSLARESVAAVEFSPLPLGEEPRVRAGREWVRGQEAEVRGQGLSARGPAASAAGDLVLLLNGDQLSGRFVQLADGVIKFHADFGPLEIKIDRVAAIVFQSDSSPPAKQETTLRAWVGLGDGSRLLADRLLIVEQKATIAVAGQTITVPAEQIVFLQPLGGRVAYLSDLRPVEYHYTPLLPRPPSDAQRPTLAWPWRADRNVLGGPLRAGGRTYLKGLGVHAAARLVYELGGAEQGMGDEGRRTGGGDSGFGDSGVRGSFLQGLAASAASESPMKAVRFEALAALDQSAGSGGSVRFRVLLDGVEKYAGEIVRGGQQPVPISVELGEAKRLELVVDFADRGDVLARADWLDARLVLEARGRGAGVRGQGSGSGEHNPKP